MYWKKEKPDSKGFAGAIVSIIGSFILTFVFLWLSIRSFVDSDFEDRSRPLIGIIYLGLMCTSIASVYFGFAFLKDYNQRLIAGILGIIGGGILILVSYSSED